MIFKKAILRLTIAFSAILLLVFGLFAFGIYSFVTINFDFDVPELTTSEVVITAEQSFALLRTALLVSYGALALIAPFLSFAMARQVLKPAQKSYDLQQAFVDDASHEFRSPLAIIQGEIELALNRPRTGPEYQRVLAISLDEVRHLSSLTTDLLLLARGNSEGLISSFSSVSLDDVLSGAQRLPSVKEAENSIRIMPHDNVTINGSENLLVRAFANILDNAVKFSAPGAQIDVQVAHHGATVGITVIDHGAGMNANTLSHAFDRFWRAEEARSAPGHGLGLALVQRICAIHSGKISLVSEPGKGTAVTMIFPVILSA